MIVTLLQATVAGYRTRLTVLSDYLNSANGTGNPVPFLPLSPPNQRTGAVIAEARDLLAATGRRTLLFIDELHRFNRTQQDVLLADVEDGTVILIGATTLNPFFSINSPLVSRSQIFQFEPLSEDEMRDLLYRAQSTDKASACPHGRPTTISLSLKELETNFHRT